MSKYSPEPGEEEVWLGGLFLGGVLVFIVVCVLSLVVPL
jgi:hypothetical protein